MDNEQFIATVEAKLKLKQELFDLEDMTIKTMKDTTSYLLLKQMRKSRARHRKEIKELKILLEMKAK